MVKWIRGAAGMVFLAAFLWGCSPGQADEQMAEEQQQAVAGLEGRDVQRVTQTASPEPEGTGIAVNPSGAVLSERIPVPSGFQRTDAGEGSFQDYIRSYPLKPDRSPVMLYDGSERETRQPMQRYLLCLYLTVICSSARTASCVCTESTCGPMGPVMRLHFTLPTDF